MDKKISDIIIFFYLILSIMILVFSIKIFYVGFHNLDLAQNGRFLSCNFNTSLMDYNGINYISMEDMYYKGWVLMEKGFFILGVSCFLLGFYINYYISKNGIRK